MKTSLIKSLLVAAAALGSMGQSFAALTNNALTNNALTNNALTNNALTNNGVAAQTAADGARLTTLHQLANRPLAD